MDAELVWCNWIQIWKLRPRGWSRGAGSVSAHGPRITTNRAPFVLTHIPVWPINTLVTMVTGPGQAPRSLALLT